MSKYHFHRLCAAYFGLPLGALVIRLRMKKAAYQLAYRPQLKILDISLDAGFETHEGFTRAFRKLFDASPSQFRSSPDWSTWQQHYEPIHILRNKIMKPANTIKVDIVDFPATQIATMEHRGAPNLIGQTIGRFIQWRRANGLPPNKSRTFNLAYDDPRTTASEDYRFDLACTFDNPIQLEGEGIIEKCIPAGPCARVRHIGSDDSLAQSVDFLYRHWLPESECELRDFPVFFERVSFFPEVPEQEMITDIYLPIE
mgnify:CR=1 FL=1